MRFLHKPRTRADRRDRRHLRVRKKVTGTAARPRLVVFRSLKHIYAQLVDDEQGRTLMTISDVPIESGKKTERSLEVGKQIASKAKEAGITTVVFDRGGYKYHGRVKAVAEGARAGGLEF
jgi:large subunit ribosomal protein L18